MGQRLNIEIVDTSENTVLANAYYHWGAYSGSAAEYAKDMIHSPEWDQLMKEPTVENAVKLLLLTGAGFNEAEIAEIKAKDLLPDELLVPTKGRNEGIISVTEQGIEETQMYAEGTMYIFTDVDTQYIDIADVFNYIGDTEYGIEDPYYDEVIDDEDSEFNGMKRSDVMAGIETPDICLGSLTPEIFDKFFDVVQTIYKQCDDTYLLDAAGNIYTLIE